MSLEREIETILRLKDNMFLVQCSMIHCQIDVAFQWVSQDFEPHPGGRDHGFQVWGRHGPLPTSFNGGWQLLTFTHFSMSPSQVWIFVSKPSLSFRGFPT